MLSEAAVSLRIIWFSVSKAFVLIGMLRIWWLCPHFRLIALFSFANSHRNTDECETCFRLYSPDESQHKEGVYTIKSTLHGNVFGLFPHVPQKPQLFIYKYVITLFMSLCHLCLFIANMHIELQNVSMLTYNVSHMYVSFFYFWHGCWIMLMCYVILLY